MVKWIGEEIKLGAARKPARRYNCPLGNFFTLRPSLFQLSIGKTIHATLPRAASLPTHGSRKHSCNVSV